MKSKLISGLLLLVITISSIIKATEAKKVYQEKSCLDVAGKQVDWFVIFLFPKTSNKEGKLSYAYYDDKSKDIEYYEYKDENFPGISIMEEYDSSNYFFWNDDITIEGSETQSASSGKAHSKGGLIYNQKTGLIFSHSLPRFPTRNDDNEIVATFPSNAGIYGQTFICISLNKESALKAVDTLNVINPPLVINVDSDVVENPTNDAVEKLIKNRFDSKLPSNMITEIASLKGQKFQIFSKSRKEENLPYDEFIPKFYNDGLYVETWTKPAQIQSKCDNSYKVINVISLEFGKFKFDKNQEHSKWAVGIKKDVCCFGDLNRTESQKKRGGNTICFINTKLANYMRKAIVEKEDCPKSLNFLE